MLTPSKHQFAHHVNERSGVYFDKSQGQFRAAIRVEKQRLDLGLHHNEEIALRAVAIARQLLPGLSAQEMRKTADRIKHAARDQHD